MASEADVCTNEKVRAVYPKTPHPGSLKSPQLSSTPLGESSTNISDHVQSPVLACSPRAISFDDCSQPCVMGKPNPEPPSTETCNANELPTLGVQPERAKEKDATEMMSPGLPKDEDLRAEGELKLDDLHRDLSKRE